jgi:hypothetical protein
MPARPQVDVESAHVLMSNDTGGRTYRSQAFQMVAVATTRTTDLREPNARPVRTESASCTSRTTLHSDRPSTGCCSTAPLDLQATRTSISYYRRCTVVVPSLAITDSLADWLSHQPTDLPQRPSREIRQPHAHCRSRQWQHTTGRCFHCQRVRQTVRSQLETRTRNH